MVENAREGVWLLDEGANTGFVNKSMAKMLGYTPEQMRGQSLFKFAHRQDTQRLEQSFNQARSGMGEHHEIHMQCKDGGGLWFLRISHPLKDERGKFCGTLDLLIDITDQKVFEQTAFSSERMYKDIFNSAGVAIWEEDVSGLIRWLGHLDEDVLRDGEQYFKEHPKKIVEAVSSIIITRPNPAAVEMFGAKSSAELRGPLSRFFNAESYKCFIPALCDVLSGQRLIELELPLQRLNGKPFQALIRVHVPDDFNDPELVSIVDISKRVELEWALRASEERFRDFAEAEADWFWEVAADLKFTYLSGKLEEVTGISPSQVLGESYEVFYKDQPYISTWVEHLNILKSEQADFDLEVPWVRPDKSMRMIRLAGKPTYDAAGTLIGFRGVGRDVTEQKQQQSALQKETVFLDAVISQAAEGLCVFHAIPEPPRVRFTVWNDRMREITGYSMEQANFPGWYEQAFPDSGYREQLLDRMRRVYAGEDMRTEEWDITCSDQSARVLSISTSTLPKSDGPPHTLALMLDVTDKRRHQNAVLKIARGVSGGGERFFYTLLENLSSALGGFYAFIGKRISVNSDSVESLSVYSTEGEVEKFSFKSNNSPCADVLMGKIGIYPDGVCDLFPDDELLMANHAQAFAGSPLVDSAGNTMGLLAVLFKESINDLQEIDSTLSIFASRASAELERKDVEDAIRDEHQRFQNFAESASDWFWEMGADLRYSYVSERIFDFLCIPAESLLGRSRFDLPAKGYDVDKWDMHRAKLENHEPFRDFEYYIKCPVAKRQCIRVSGTPIFSEEGTFLGYRGVGRNITEEIEAKENELLLKSRLHDALESVPGGMILFDKDDRLILCNTAYRTSVSEISDVLQPGTPFESISRALAEKGLVDLEGGTVEEWVNKRNLQHEEGVAFTLKVKGDRWVEVQEYTTQEGGTLMLRADITDRLQVEERLQQAATVFSNTREGVMITNTDGLITAVNGAFTEITGYAENDVIGLSPDLLKSDKHEASFYTEIEDSLSDQGYWRGEIWSKRQSGEIYPEWKTESTVTDNDGNVTHHVSVFSDISDIKESEQQLEYLAHHDPLTELPNRLLFTARLDHALERSQRDGTFLAVLFIDLDNFKNINDSLGHPAGDALLRGMAHRLRSLLREEDTVSRLGGDEFTVLLEQLSHPEMAGAIAAKLVECFSAPFRVENNSLHVTGSIGISICPTDGIDAATLLRNADAAMYKAKENGRNGYQYYTAELTKTAFERVLLENSLRRALKLDQFVVYYQPQISLKDGRLVGAEALVRWQHPEMGLVPPIRFISLAEDAGLIGQLGEWVLRSACYQAKAWQDAGIKVDRIAVNLSGQQLRRKGLVGVVKDALSKSGLAAKHLELEITEGFIMEQAEQAIGVLEELQRLGVTLSIDDFGTGYSSLSYLKLLPITTLKIDQSFVCDIPTDPNDEAIAKAIIALAKSLQLNVLAEGVETDAQRDFLQREGCDEVQGFLYNPALPAAEFEHAYKYH